MQFDVELQSRRFPTLVQYCQRVASAHADSICSFGDDIRYDLIKPILQNCSADTLLRLEETRPDLEGETGELWRNLCFRCYPIPAEKFQTDSDEEPESWRDTFFLLQETEAKRFEELGTRLRSIRKEEAERKKESQIKLTDKLPPPKRGRWGAYQPKTLIQKTRSEAARMQKGIYGTRLIPPMRTAKTYGSAPSTLNTQPSSVSSSTVKASGYSVIRPSSSRVTVNTVTVCSPPRNASSDGSTSPPPSRQGQNNDNGSLPAIQMSSVLSPASPPTDSNTPSQRIPQAGKKDPMSSLFMPKRHAHSQLSTRSRNT